MSALADAAEHYVMLRRAVGFKLEDADRVLGDYACFAEAHGTQRVTAALALEWAQLGSSPSRCSHRLQVLGRFAVWFQAFDPDSELPPPATVSAYRRRRNPYLYSPTEITALMDAARGLQPRLWAATTETVIGVLAATGMRVGEVLRLNRSDVGWDEATVTVWHTKFDKSRLVPLSASTMAALVAYDRLRRDTRTVRSSPALFVAPRGGRLDYPRFRATFVVLLDAAGIATPGDRRQPRIHDLRHSFAVRTVTGWYRDGQDVQAMLPRLSTYLGHGDPAATYWYLSAAPELLSLAADRLERTLEGGA